MPSNILTIRDPWRNSSALPGKSNKDAAKGLDSILSRPFAALGRSGSQSRWSEWRSVRAAYFVVAARLVETVGGRPFPAVTERAPLKGPTVFGAVKRTTTLHVLFVARLVPLMHVVDVVEGNV